MRLCEKGLSALPASIRRPVYDRSKVTASIVHLGLGAFHRAHQALMTEAVLNSGDLAWGIVGAGMQSSGMRDGPPPGGRDFGLGPLSEALSREDRKALRAIFVERHHDLRGSRREMRAEFDALVAALRAEPFDPAALDAALAAIAARNQALLDTGRELVAERLKAMDGAGRAAFADRLEKHIGREKKRKDDDGKDGDDRD